MAGTIIEALPIHRLDFSHVVGGETQQRLLTLWPIDVVNYTEGTLLVRWHHGDSIASNHSITIKVFTVCPSTEDPQMLFSLEDTAVASVTIDSSTTPPVGDEGTLLKAAFSSNFGTSVVVVAEGYRPASPSDLKASISVELALAGRKAS